ncbi:TIR domain-containing protein [Thalassomonas viridans]|uniref:Biotin carboxyl carrier protein of acetyl-CoA carboxylase n=1 Tax=Thalassomonas viridans TaxID=137584 RepID=A0AAF0CDB5_9GAMM|nr:biotin/lipoyl-containing protein [Thalassomonas viridans]WDE09028.1 TIR domain-containing protein [Thalassomonas viridans]
MKKVFISYSHESDKHKAWVAKLAAKLRQQGIDAMIDRYAIPEEPWPQWMQNQILNSDITLLVCTKEYRLRFEGKSQAKGVTWEGLIANQILYDNRCKNKKFIAVLPSSEDIEFIPIPYKGYPYFVLYEQFKSLLRYLDGKAELDIPELAASPLEDKALQEAPKPPAKIDLGSGDNINYPMYIQANVYSPISGTISEYGVISSKILYEDRHWENITYQNRVLLTHDERISDKQSFLMVVEKQTREPILITSHTELVLKDSLKHGDFVEAHDKIATVYIPISNTYHPPYTVTRGETFAGVFRYSPYLRSSVWRILDGSLKDSQRIIKCRTNEKSGVCALEAQVSGTFHPNKGLDVGHSISIGDNLGQIDSDSGILPVVSTLEGIITTKPQTESTPVFVGKSLLEIRVSPNVADIQVEPVRGKHNGWFNLFAPADGHVSFNALNPGYIFGEQTVIATVYAKNVTLNLSISITEGEIMSLCCNEGDKVSYGDKLLSVRALKVNIISPLIGRFYLAPLPGAKPFVEVGDTIEPGQTVCMIEALKTEHRINNEYKAIVESIEFRDGDKVEWDSVLIRTKLIW